MEGKGNRMKWSFFFCAVFWIGCHQGHDWGDDRKAWSGIEEDSEEFKTHELQARIRTDILWREFDRRLDQGSPSPRDLDVTTNPPTCKLHQKPVAVLILSQDVPERHDRGERMAYYCRRPGVIPEQGVYWYRRVYAERNQDVYFGPAEIRKLKEQGPQEVP